MSSKSFYITTAIDYVNSRPHLGTAYEKIAADVIARHRRMRGDDVFFLMGNDEHSLKVETAAREKGLDPLAYCDQMEEVFIDVWGALDVRFDDFIRTSQDRHKEAVREIVNRIHEAGDIYEGNYEGWYCNGCEAFKTETELDQGKQCPEHPNQELSWLEERNYFFRLSNYGDFLLDHYEENPLFLQPDFRRNEMLDVIRGGLKDISISRESANWGVSIPFDDSAVVYVWFDALVNYISGIGFPGDTEGFDQRWPANLHLIGKDITRFHCIIWPAMLKSAGLSLPEQVFGHGFVNVPTGRMSKSEGTVIDPLALVSRYGADTIRYYILAEASFGRDVEYSEERLIIRANSDLANGLGNLVSRTISMVIKYRSGELPQSDSASLISDAISSAVDGYSSAMDSLQLKRAIDAAMEIVNRANLLVEEEAPWHLAKDPEKSDRLDRVLADLHEACRCASVLLSPFMPAKMADLRGLLKVQGAMDEPAMAQAAFGASAVSGNLEKSDPLFPRIEPPEVE